VLDVAGLDLRREAVAELAAVCNAELGAEISGLMVQILGRVGGAVGSIPRPWCLPLIASKHELKVEAASHVSNDAASLRQGEGEEIPGCKE
jgi:hypothetical protein